MTYQLTPEFGQRLLPHRLNIKRMSVEAAKLYLDKYMPDVEGEERDYALSLAGQNIPTPPPPTNIPQGPFKAAMFMAGVSLGDLAMLYGVTRQAIQASIRRILSSTERHTIRDVLPGLDLESLQLAREMYMSIKHADPNAFEGVHPLEVGRSLLSAANAVVGQDRGDAPALKRPRKYTTPVSDSKLNTSHADVEAGQLGDNQLKSLGDLFK